MVVFDLGDRIVVARPDRRLQRAARLLQDTNDRNEGLEARDFRRRMAEAWAAAEYPVKKRDSRLGV